MLWRWSVSRRRKNMVVEGSAKKDLLLWQQLVMQARTHHMRYFPSPSGIMRAAVLQTLWHLASIASATTHGCVRRQSTQDESWSRTHFPDEQQQFHLLPPLPGYWKMQDRPFLLYQEAYQAPELLSTLPLWLLCSRLDATEQSPSPVVVPPPSAPLPRVAEFFPRLALE